MSGATALLVMVPDRQTGLAIARAVVSERLAAAANLLAPGISVFHWQGAMRETEELPLLLKTRSGLTDALMARVVALHPYEVPGVMAVSVSAAPASWLAWLDEVTKEPDARSRRRRQATRLACPQG